MSDDEKKVIEEQVEEEQVEEQQLAVEEDDREEIVIDLLNPLVTVSYTHLTLPTTPYV